MTTRPSAPSLLGLCTVPFAALLGSCISHSVKSAPIEIQPIFITMDINLRVQRELDEFFDFEQPAPDEAQKPDQGKE